MSSTQFFKYGTGNTSVILMHGFCEDHRIYDDILPHLDGKNYTWFFPDFPGFGDAVDTKLLELSMTGYADYIRDWMLDQSKPKAILAGHSMGGYVALEFAHLYPEALQGLILLHSQAGADNLEKRRSRDEHIRFIEKNGMLKFAEKLLPLLYMEDWRSSNKDILDIWIERVSEYPQKSVIAALHCMRERKDHRDLLQRMQVPVGVIAGKCDPLIAIETSLEEAALPCISSIKMLDNAGHMGMVEASEDFANALQSCVDDLVMVQA
jgi:pimeloyl-ACP methyl ester carboxylesterase